MSEQDKIEKIGRVDQSVSGAEKINKFDHIAPNREYFDHLMTQKAVRDENLAATVAEEARKPSPMEEAQRAMTRVEKTENSSLNQVLAQAEQAIEKIDSVKRKLNTPDLELKSSVQNVLRSKLSHIDESLKIALSKVGVDYTPPDKPQGLVTPIQRFLGYLTNGQNQLESLTQQVNQMQQHKDQLSPAALLSIQLKVGFMNQELEFFSSLLNKALESTKTLMNVQV